MDDSGEFIMAIQRKRPLVASSPDVLGNGADHPDHPEKMIGVAMGQERVMDVGRAGCPPVQAWVKMALPPPASTSKGSLPSRRMKHVL